MGLTHLQLLDRFPSFADDQPHFRCRDKKLLDCAVAVYIVVKARPIPTSVHNLPQEPFGLSLGGRKITREPALNGCLRRSGKGDGARENTNESRQPSIQLQLLPHNLGGLNHSPRYRTAIQRQHTAQHNAELVSRGVSGSQPPSDPIPHVCTCLHPHSALPPTCNVTSSVLSFVHLCSPIQHNPPRETLSTLVSEGGKRRSGERRRKQGLVARLQFLSSNVPVASNTALELPAKPVSPVWFRTGGPAAAVLQGAPDWCSPVGTLYS